MRHEVTTKWRHRFIELLGKLQRWEPPCFFSPQQRIHSISGNNYTQAAFQEGGNLSFHLQLNQDQMQDGVGLWKRVHSRYV